MFPRCRRPRARDPRGALDHMRLGSPHTDLRWHPYRVQGGGLTGEHRLTAGVRSYRLGRVATGCNQGDARVGCIVCSMTASSPTERESGSELLAQAGGECLHSAGGVVAAAADAPVDHVCTRGAATRQRSPARGGTAALTPAQPTTRGRPPPVPDGKQRLGQQLRRPAAERQAVVGGELFERPRGAAGQPGHLIGDRRPVAGRQ